MADTKVTSNGYISVWWVPASGMVDYRSPTPTEINSGVELTNAIAWDTYDIGASDSNDTDDRSINDRGNAQSRGYQQFSGSLAMFRDTDGDDSQSPYVQAFETFRTPRQLGYLVVRLLQKEQFSLAPAAAGEWVSVFKFISDAITDDTEGEDSVKLGVEFMPQGDVAVYTKVKTALPVVPSEATVSVGVGDHEAVKATLGGDNITQGARWRSDDTAVASVSRNGVITGVSAGTAEITVSHPAAGTDGTVTVTVTGA